MLSTTCAGERLIWSMSIISAANKRVHTFYDKTIFLKVLKTFLTVFCKTLKTKTKNVPACVPCFSGRPTCLDRLINIQVQFELKTEIVSRKCNLNITTIMALRVVVARLHAKAFGAGSSILRVNNSFCRMKHFNNELPLAKHTKKPSSTLRLITSGVAVGVVIGVAYSYFSKPERKLPGALINTPKPMLMLETLPPDLKITRKVWTSLLEASAGHLFLILYF